jgi:hypothetical protein
MQKSTHKCGNDLRKKKKKNYVTGTWKYRPTYRRRLFVEQHGKG